MPVRFKKNPVQALSNQAYLLFLLPFPLIPALFIVLVKGDFTRLIVYLLTFGLFLAGALLTRTGLQAQAEYNRRKIASAPKIPFKTIGAITVSAATFICAYLAVRHQLAFSVALALLTLGGFYLAYGLDPRRDKATTVTAHGYTTAEVVQAIEQAERKIAEIDAASRGIRNFELRARLTRISELARKILRVIEEDPTDLRRARKFLYVYLDGAKTVSKGYVRTHQRSQSAELETNFRNVLITIENVFQEQHANLLENDILDLDVQIEVLATQLKREGVV